MMVSKQRMEHAVKEHIKNNAGSWCLLVISVKLLNLARETQWVALAFLHLNRLYIHTWLPSLSAVLSPLHNQSQEFLKACRLFHDCIQQVRFLNPVFMLLSRRIKGMLLYTLLFWPACAPRFFGRAALASASALTRTRSSPLAFFKNSFAAFCSRSAASM